MPAIFVGYVRLKDGTHSLLAKHDLFHWIVFSSPSQSGCRRSHGTSIELDVGGISTCQRASVNYYISSIVLSETTFCELLVRTPSLEAGCG